MPEAPPISEIERQVRLYQTNATLSVINRITQEEGGESEIGLHFPGPAKQGHKQPLFTQNGLSFISRQSIFHSDDFRGSGPTWRDILRMSHIYNAAAEPSLSGAPDHYSIVAFLLRAAYEQFPLQRARHSLLGRALYLFDQLPQRLLGSPGFVNLPQIFRNLVGLEIRRFVECGLIFFSAAMRGVSLNDTLFTKPDTDGRFLDAADVRAALEFLSIGYPRFREQARATQEPTVSEKYAFNPLWSWPIVKPSRVTEGQFIVPVPRLLLERFTNGLYYDFLNPAFPETERKKVLDSLGTVFEEYVGDLAKAYYAPGDCLQALPYGGGKETIDWILVEGEVAILVECKTKRLRLISKTAASPADVVRDLQLALVRAVQQLHETTEAILGRAVGLEVLLHVNRVVPIIVVAEPIYLANSPLLRGLIASDLATVGLDKFQFQVTSVGEFESLLPWREDGPLSQILLDKMADPDAQMWDLGPFVAERFRTSRTHKLLDQVTDQFVSSLGVS